MADDSVPVVDIFAGPGGLGEGFSALTGRFFRIAVSAEMEPSAHQTLLARAYFRGLETRSLRRQCYYPIVSQLGSALDESIIPDHSAASEALAIARSEALRIELGNPRDDAALAVRVRKVARSDDRWVLVGGPPCQAYSVAGRARNRGKSDYVFEKDKRSHLYKHYLDLIGQFGPAVFVMENVKGLLTARINGESMFTRIVDDLHDIRHIGRRYRLFSLTEGAADDATSADSFIVRCEEHGIPQARHRVIILGVREDILGSNQPRRLGQRDRVRLEAAHMGLPRLRSGISRDRESRSTAAWVRVVQQQYAVAAAACDQAGQSKMAELLRRMETPAEQHGWNTESSRWSDDPSALIDLARRSGLTEELAKWLIDPDMTALCNHEARAHMASDLGRYAFVAAFRMIYGRSPKSPDFPQGLAPAHKNWEDGSFADRFFVQPPRGQCSTVTSHIAKDGHHFIHWDPLQCRAFTVREAARAQTFPDNYVFLGNRTQQFTQVGNAVPPYLAHQIARIVKDILA